ncbi:MAG: hypothetical protein FWG75_10435 [Cystobacterineae bacterium]|nr:hypothetical protein [Cystobacterineae bacterium]
MPTAYSTLFPKHFFRVCFLGLCLAVGVQASPGKAGSKALAKKKEVLELYEDIEALRPKIYLYTDGNGHYLALTQTLNESHPKPMFWGDGSVFFAQRTSGSSYKKQKKKSAEEMDVFWEFKVSFWDPRTPYETYIEKNEDGVISVDCREKGRKALLKKVPDAESKAMVEKATFYHPRFMRWPHLLFRDDKAIYYYIDRSAKEGEKDFRIFIGKAGQLKQTKLKNVVQDNAGEIFATPDGSLRMVISQNSVYWTSGKKKQLLTELSANPYGNGPFLFNELGVYVNQKLSTPCDDL